MSTNTFDLAKQPQNFIHAQQRPSCQGCKHVSRMVHGNGNVGLQCMKGGFFVTPMSVCEPNERFVAAPAEGI
jgi:hypothetical protein